LSRSSALGAIREGPSRGGLFLSEDGYTRVRRAYDAITGRGPISKLREAEGVLWENRWTAFDDVYLAIYCSRLAALKAPVEGGPKLERLDLTLACRLYVLLDMDIPHFSQNALFEETLISEYAVMDLMYFRGALQNLVPYPLRLERFALGCVEMEFGVYAPRSSGAEIRPFELIGLNPASLQSSNAWVDLYKRFKVVQHIEMRPA